MIILRFFRNLFYFCVVMSVFGILIAWTYAKKLEAQYQLDSHNLGGALWSMPARVYARPLELYAGAPVSKAQLLRELELLEYRKVKQAVEAGQYEDNGDNVIYYAAEFAFWDGLRPLRRMQISFADGKVSRVDNLTSFEEIGLERLNPLRIASIYPQQREDRLLVKLDEVPPVLIDTILATEDRNFYYHFGVDPKGLLRSIYVTYVKKGDQQGGSTITQQFIKNHYLSNERSIARKVKEMLMAIVLESHSNKRDILEGYINEIYLGQDGQRAIHGFGLASEYYFNKPISELNLHEVAMLVALVREPGNADPRKNPEYATQRRALMLKIMAQQGLISQQEAEMAAALPLDIAPVERTRERIRYPEFMDLVSQQLQQNYSREDLTRQGLNIFTTLDPQIQEDAQKALSSKVEKLEKQKGFVTGFLQGAGVIVESRSADVVAVIGSRYAGEQGFNRAVSAKRQIGSLVKPMVYLAGLEAGKHLASELADKELPKKVGWQPKNYSGGAKGNVMFIQALAKSYNLATAQLALDETVGLDKVVKTLERLGSRKGIQPYPSLSLGAVQMTPLEVAQIYETFASGGYRQPLRAVRDITTQQGELVKRFDIQSVRAITPENNYLITRAMQEVTRAGTATAVYQKDNFDKSYNLAGKTGTTDNYRDSWFAGFSGNYLAVAWVGNDQNQPMMKKINNKLTIKVSGSDGGLPLWIDLMKQVPVQPLNLEKPEDIIIVNIRNDNFGQAGRGCKNTISLPFNIRNQPSWGGDCYTPPPPNYDDIYDGSFAAPEPAQPLFNGFHQPW